MSPFSERIKNDNIGKNTKPLRTITYNTSFLTQFRWVLKRTFLNLMLNPQTSIAQVFTSPSLSLKKKIKSAMDCFWQFQSGFHPFFKGEDKREMKEDDMM